LVLFKKFIFSLIPMKQIKLILKVIIETSNAIQVNLNLYILNQFNQLYQSSLTYYKYNSSDLTPRILNVQLQTSFTFNQPADVSYFN
jgi:hypothetical protein